MSGIKEFDLSAYLRDEKISLENVRLENCRLVTPEYDTLVFKKCVLQNVIIEGDHEGWKDTTAAFYECEFRDCVFRGNFGEIFLVWEENLLKDCLFENIYVQFGGDISHVTNNGFFNCNFINVNLIQDIEFLSQTISGGKMQNVRLMSFHMAWNLFSGIQMEQVNISALYSSNVMDSIVFRNVMLEWEAEDDEYPDENLFCQCDTKGLTVCKREFG